MAETVLKLLCACAARSAPKMRAISRKFSPKLRNLQRNRCKIFAATPAHRRQTMTNTRSRVLHAHAAAARLSCAFGVSFFNFSTPKSSDFCKKSHRFAFVSARFWIVTRAAKPSKQCSVHRCALSNGRNISKASVRLRCAFRTENARDFSKIFAEAA